MRKKLIKKTKMVKKLLTAHKVGHSNSKHEWTLILMLITSSFVSVKFDAARNILVHIWPHSV